MNEDWKYPEKNEYPKTSDGLVFCETEYGEIIKLICFKLNDEYKFYNGDNRFIKVTRWHYI